MEEQNAEVIGRDSAAVAAYVAKLSGVEKTATGLMYVVSKKGSGKKAKKGDNVSVQYVGSLLDGTVFDQTKAGSPDFNFPVGMGQVIPGWDEAFQMMSEGDEYKLIIPWSLAYGPRGSGPIPPYSSFVFEVKLVKIN
jgi:FKBP-type peptidyl-prolyl cis-trans isomerase